MIDTKWRGMSRPILHAGGGQISRMGVTADQLTAVGFLAGVSAALAIAHGHVILASAVIGLMALCDMFDGAVARVSGTASPGGAFTDSVVDLGSDALILGGIAWYLSTNHAGRIGVLPLAVLVVVFIVPFERARAEALGYEVHGDLVERVERLLLIWLGLVVRALLVPVLWLLLVVTLYTAVHRFFRVRRRLRLE